MRKLPTRKLLATFIAGALFLPNQGFTLGLGEIEVNSALNQKLNADIEVLSAAPEDAASIIVKLASSEEFLRAGLDRPFELNDLRFKAVLVNDTPHIIVSSGSPVREPFLNFLIEVDWPNGRLIREYTVLLDPPAFMTQAAGSPAAGQVSAASDNAGFRPAAGSSNNVLNVSAPAPGAEALAARPAVEQPSVVNPAFMPAPMVQQQTSINQPPGSYRIKSGDTAWSLADAMRPDQSISVEQMMIAMLRASPESFIKENINGLKRGYILRTPDYDQITSISQADARAMVREQAALWRQYQQSQASAQPVSAMPTDGASDSMPGADGEAGSDEAAASTDAYLEIVSAGSGSSTTSGKDPVTMSAAELRAELALARERVETERVEKEALQQRVSTLQQNIEKMQGLLSIEDEGLSGAQALNALDKQQLAALADDAAMQQQTTEPGDEPAESQTADELTAEQPAIDQPAAEMVQGSEQDVADDAVFVDEGAAQDPVAELADAGTADMPGSDADDISANAQADAELTEQPVASPLSSLFNNPLLLAAGAGILLLIAAVFGRIMKRRKAAAATVVPVAAASDDLERLADDLAATDTAAEAVMSGATADEREVTENTHAAAATLVQDSAEDTVITEAESSAAAQEETRDDVIAEADVYLAYGIYQQAEELLTQAIADNPDRDDYRVKLAETHYANKDSEAFLEVAADIRKRVADDDAPAWKKVMVMGQGLCPGNAMFLGSMVGGIGGSSLTPSVPEMDFDLGINESADDTLADLNLAAEGEPLELPDLETGTDELAALDESTLVDQEDSSVENFDELEFDLSDTGAVEDSVAAEDEFSLDIDASELDIDVQPEAAAIDEQEDITSADFAADFDLESVDTEKETTRADDLVMDFAAEPGEVSADEEDLSLDLSDEVELMEDDSPLAGFAEELEPAAATSSVSDAYGELVNEEDFDLSSLDDVDEVSTKLDLARAYLDMGDHEGSRGILEEVLAEGNDEQKEEARELISKLD